jgi:hypothetical protein
MMLWISLTARNSGQRASKLLGIEGEVCALNFDLACTLRLLRFDNERENERFKTLGAMLGGGNDEADDTGLIKGRITKDTQYW